MKQFYVFIYLVPGFFFFSCKKEGVSSLEGKSAFRDSAVQFLKSSLSSNDFSNLDLSTGVPLRYHNQNIGFKVSERNSLPDNFVVLYKKNESFLGNAVTITHIESLLSNGQQGSITIKSLDKKLSTQLIISKNKVIQILKSKGDGFGNYSSNNISSINRAQKYLLPDVSVTAYVNDSYYWNMYCLCGDEGGTWLYTSAVNDNAANNSSGSQVPTNNVAAAPNFEAPKTPIVDIKEELKCFNNDASSSYSITVNVNQPYPNSRDKVNLGADFKVGHSFLTLQQTNTDGSQITRTVGFYPKTAAYPGSSVDKSTFGDDSNTPYTVSLKISVSGVELISMISTLIDQQSENFDLNNFNCTNSAIGVLSSINVNLPSTTSGLPFFFKGNDPADLGQDLRSLDLDEFSSANGGRKVTRSQSNANNQNPSPTSGSC